MKTFLLTGFILFVLLSACGGRMLVPDCHGDTYCYWEEVPAGKQHEACCPSASYPYCGKADTNCPVGDCCNAPPM